MKKSKSSVHLISKPQFITDNSGHKQYVVLKLDDYKNLMEDYQDLLIAAERRSDNRVSFEVFEKKLKKDGRI